MTAEAAKLSGVRALPPLEIGYFACRYMEVAEYDPDAQVMLVWEGHYGFNFVLEITNTPIHGERLITSGFLLAAEEDRCTALDEAMFHMAYQGALDAIETRADREGIQL